MRTLLAVLGLLISPSVLPSAPPAIAETITGSPDIFPISFWCGPPRKFVNVERYQQVKDAGFTFIMPDCVGGNEPELQKKILETARKVGLKAIIDDQRMPHAIQTEADRRAVDAIIADYGSHPALAGYYVGDEPHSGKFAGLGEVFSYLKEKDPKHPADTNIMPNWARPEHTGLPTYEEYVRQFMETVKPPILCYDHYSFFTKSDRPGYFANLALIRSHAKHAEVPFWQIVQATSHGDYRRVTEAEKRWEIMHAIAYGAKGVLYFTYWEPDADPIWDEAIIALDGTPTRQYEGVKRVNRDAQAIGKHLLNAISIAVKQQGRPGDQTYTVEDLPLWFDGPNITVGYFADRNRRLMMFVNRDYKNAVDTSVMINTRGKPLQKLDRESEKWVPVGTRKDAQIEVRLSVPAGDAELYRWQQES